MRALCAAVRSVSTDRSRRHRRRRSLGAARCRADRDACRRRLRAPLGSEGGGCDVAVLCRRSRNAIGGWRGVSSTSSLRTRRRVGLFGIAVRTSGCGECQGCRRHDGERWCVSSRGGAFALVMCVAWASLFPRGVDGSSAPLAPRSSSGATQHRARHRAPFVGRRWIRFDSMRRGADEDASHRDADVAQPPKRRRSAATASMGSITAGA